MSAPALPRRPGPSLALAVPLALAAAAYARVIDARFQFDDAFGIERNSAVKDLGAFLRERLLSMYLSAQRPITDLTFALNYEFGRLEPRNFHLTNIAIHLGAVVAVWALTGMVLRLAGAARRDWLAVGVAGLFAVHPLQSQAVSYVTQRSEVLSSALYAATLLVVFAAERRGLGRRGAATWIGALALYVLALGAKPIAVTLPVAWLLLAAVVPSPERRRELLAWRERLVAAVPFAALSALYVARALRDTAGHADAGFSVPGLPAGSYLLTELRVLLLYLRLLFWPAGQNADWDFTRSRSIGEPAVLFAGAYLLVLVAGALALVRASRRWREEDGAAARVAGFGLLWFFLVLSVTSSFVPLADVVMEHRVYLASWGIFLAVAVGVERLAAHARAAWARPAALAAALVAWIALALALHARNAVWESPRALWADSASKSPRKARVHMSLADALMREGDLTGAVAASMTALRVVGDDRFVEVEILRNLGAAYVLLGRLDDAEATFRRALALDPREAAIWNNLSVTLRRKGDLAGAETAARRAIAQAAGRFEPWNALGEVLLARGQALDALRAFERAIQVDPDYPVGHHNRATALARLGRVPEACAVWGALQPGDPDLASRAARAAAEAGCGFAPAARAGR